MSSEDKHRDLPKGWSRIFSNSQQRHYYFHKETKHTQWHFPTASEVADPTKAKKRADMNRAQEKRKQEGLGTIVSRVGAVESPATKRPRTTESTSTTSTPSMALTDATSVAIIVPYRDLHPAQQRASHLARFVPHMHQFFAKVGNKVTCHHVYIVEQSDDGRKFNRGKLLNIGFDLARKSGRNHDVFIFHDVDLLPDGNLGDWYAQFPKQPLHIARVWDRYSNNPKYFGGVVSFSESDFKRINGYPNTFWGWGGEDDELQKRLERLRMKWKGPPSGTLVDLEEMSLSEKLDFLRENKEWKCMVKWEALEEHEATWKINGLANLKYKVLDTRKLNDQATKVTVDVLLNNHWADDKAGVDYLPS